MPRGFAAYSLEWLIVSGWSSAASSVISLTGSTASVLCWSFQPCHHLRIHRAKQDAVEIRVNAHGNRPYAVRIEASSQRYIRSQGGIVYMINPFIKSIFLSVVLRSFIDRFLQCLFLGHSKPCPFALLIAYRPPHLFCFIASASSIFRRALQPRASWFHHALDPPLVGIRRPLWLYPSCELGQSLGSRYMRHLHGLQCCGLSRPEQCYRHGRLDLY